MNTIKDVLRGIFIALSVYIKSEVLLYCNLIPHLKVLEQNETSTHKRREQEILIQRAEKNKIETKKNAKYQ